LAGQWYFDILPDYCDARYFRYAHTSGPPWGRFTGNRSVALAKTVYTHAVAVTASKGSVLFPI